jgi:uncharacterized protein YndB with AHSA1/START domain
LHVTYDATVCATIGLHVRRLDLEAEPVTEVQRSIRFPLPADEVWDVICDPALLGEWFDGDAHVDLRPGGELVVTGTNGVRRAVVDDVAPGRCLTFTWTSDDEQPASTVEIELEPRDDGCEVHVREQLVEVVEVVEVVDVVERLPVGFQPPARPEPVHRSGEALALARS